MARSVERAARAAGMGPAEAARVVAAHGLAMAPRIGALADDHHPAYLHPGRTVLVLLRDVGPLEAATLAAAALLETEDGAVRVPHAEVARALGSDLADTVGSLPLPGADDLVEGLLALPPELALASLAERLDHLRHLHLRADLRAIWGARHEEASTVWLPFATRTHPRLAARFEHWSRAFARRLPT